MNMIVFVLVLMSPITGEPVFKTSMPTIERCEEIAAMHNAAKRNAKCEIVFTAPRY
jgi:hypothetical protein